ncbi:MAG TPA: cyclase family protein [Gammaproteobacteria bacterium]|nr:cyclase family protein [Gammaproteobacteria bacterium]
MLRTSILAIGLALALIRGADAQTWRPPLDSERCPSKWGADDQRGSGNHMGPASVLNAARLIKTGQVFELGRVLQENMPLPAGRRFEIFTKRTRYDAGTNHRSSNEELVVSEIGQVGTQFDTFSHQMIGDSLYNCVSIADAATRSGFSKFGVDKVGALMTRAVLIDVAGSKGVKVLPNSYEITPQDLQDALRKQRVALEAGDAILIYTGWGAHWGVDNALYQGSSPGIGVAAAEWLARQDPMLVGADNGGVEVAPNPDPQLAGPVHQLMLVVNGIHLLENLRLDQLAASGTHEFAFVIEPLKIQGGTGSTVAPIAIR